MGEEFNMYTQKVNELGNTLKDQAAAYIEKINDITSIVDGLAAYWGGPTYETFKATYHNNLAQLEDLNDVVKKFGEGLGDTASAGDTMISDINSAME